MKRIKVITKEETNAIREMYATGVPSQNALANHVGTSRYYIGKMVRDIVPDSSCDIIPIPTSLLFARLAAESGEETRSPILRTSRLLITTLAIFIF